MTRKDFQLIAETLGESLSHADTFNKVKAQEVAGNFARSLSHTNPRFDSSRFVDAVLNSFNRFEELNH